MPRRSHDTRSTQPPAVIRSPDVGIRCARSSDAGSIAPLFDAYRQFYGATSDVPAARRFLLERLARNESVVFIASPSANGAASESVRGSGEVVGFAQLYPSFSSVALQPIIVLNDVYVSPLWRRAHIARRLVSEIVGYASRVRAARVELSTQHTNSAARQLYKSLGFTADAAFSHLSLELPAR